MAKEQSNIVHFKANANIKTNLTKKVVKGIERRQKPYFIRDTKLVGLSIKVNPKGPAKYIVEGRLGGTGRNKRIEIGVVGVLKFEELRDRARTALGQIHDGVDPKQVEREKKLKEMSLAGLIDLYYDTNERIKEENKKIYIRDMHSLLKPFINRPTNDISPYDYYEFYKKNIATRPVYTDRIHRQLRAVYNYAVKKQISDNNPTDIVTVQDRPQIKPKDRYLNLSTEIKPFLNALMEAQIPSKSRDAMLLFLCTGMRKKEALELTWDDLDFYQFLITINDTKNKRQHVIPMSNLVRSILKSRFEDENGNDTYVFPNRNGSKPLLDLRVAIRKILEKAGIETSISLHDLRRTFTAIAQELGIEVSDIKPLLNHIDPSVTARHYLAKHTPRTLKHKRQQLNLISGFLEEVATGLPHGIRSELYLDSMFDEEKTADGDLEYTYADAYQYHSRDIGHKLTHEELDKIDSEASKTRNLELERAYDWAW